MRRGEPGESTSRSSKPSPGHQAGAPLRRGVARWLPALPIPSPGHQAGAPLRPAYIVGLFGGVPPLPPAIRPGLHCGRQDPDTFFSVSSTSPGHQAGAPLRRRRGCAGRSARSAAFPRPSGRGSIAAARGCRRRRAAARLPPAIRPGLHCGRATRSVSTPRMAASPGHQAGAPLRRSMNSGLLVGPGVFPRPSGRGSIAAPTAPCRSIATAVPSPGHQAGAPLRLGFGHGRVPPGWRLPPAIRPGLHCGLSRGGDFGWRGYSFPRPSGRGSIAAIRCGTRTG